MLRLSFLLGAVFANANDWPQFKTQQGACAQPRGNIIGEFGNSGPGDCAGSCLNTRNCRSFMEENSGDKMCWMFDMNNPTAETDDTGFTCGDRTPKPAVMMANYLGRHNKGGCRLSKSKVIGHWTGKTEEWCRQACTEDVLCKSFDIDSKNDMDCKIYSDKTIRVDYRGNSVQCYFKTISYQQSYQYRAGQFVGSKGVVLLEESGRTMSSGKCQLKCTLNTDCHSLEYHRNDRICILYDANNNQANGDRVWESYNKKVYKFENPKLAVFMPESDIELDDLNMDDLNMDDLNMDDFNMDDLNMDDLNMDDLNMDDFYLF